MRLSAGVSVAWLLLSCAAPAHASDSGTPPRWSVEGGWWHNRAGSDYERRWSGGPVAGVSMEFLRRVTRSGFLRVEYVSIASDLNELEDYFNGAIVESDGRATVTLFTVGLHGRPGGYGGGGLGQGSLARLSTNYEFAFGLAVVNESEFRYTYSFAVPPATYSIAEETRLRPLFAIGFGLEWGATSRIPLYLDGRTGVTAFHDPVMPVSLRLGTRFR